MLDYKNPDYTDIINERIERLRWMRADPERAPKLLAYYRNNLAQLISDFGWTYDPRNPEIGQPSAVPFVLFPKQVEWVSWVLDRWQNRERGLTEKSRELGVSWLAISIACGLSVTRRGLVIGFGSNLERNVDTIGNPSSLFWKAEFFMDNLPVEFRAGYSKRTRNKMLIKMPGTGSSIVGDSGNNIGRGGRTSLYFVDEAAHLEHPEDVEAALSATTNCRIDISSVKGTSSPFAQRRFSGKTSVFTFHWRDDPRKDDAWYQKQLLDLDPVTVAQEIDMDYGASVEGVLIPSALIQSAIDAHIKLGIPVEGLRRAALDVADEGRDSNAFSQTHGILLEFLEEWSGKGDDIFGTVARSFRLCDERYTRLLDYDADGLGAGVRGDARVLNESRSDDPVGVRAFRGSGGVLDPDGYVPAADPSRKPKAGFDRLNKDFFANRKAQQWWSLRYRFIRTHRAVEAGSLGQYSPDDLISLDSTLPLLGRLIIQLSQPTYSETPTGKIKVDKQPDNTASPNLADSVMICYSNQKAFRPKIGLH